MTFLKNNRRRIFFLTILLSIFALNIIFLDFSGKYNSRTNNSIKTNNNEYNIEKSPKIQGTYQVPHTDQWLKNGNFNTGVSPWKNVTLGDTSDIKANVSYGAANYDLLGDKRTFSLVSNPINSSWTAAKNTDFPFYPDVYTINGTGACVSHYWNELADQSVAVNWNKTVSMPVNMSDYTITSASIRAVCNGYVYVLSQETYSMGVESVTDRVLTSQLATGDYARFYVLLSNKRNKPDKVFEVAYNQTSRLGEDSRNIATMPDTYLIPVTQDSLIFYLSSVLSTDYRNFTISVGIRIWCEDNWGQDSDWWRLMVFKSVNLTFTYEKKMTQQTSLAWEQIGNKISGSNIAITNATLNFVYKTNSTWPSTSPNSEFRLIINNTQHSETIKLSSATTSYKYAKTGGFDVTYLIKKDVNITLSIQLYIADQFNLDRKIRVSIDNISLLISYTETKTEQTTSFDLFMNGVNKTLSKSIDIPIRETVNISINYKNSTKGFISGASVILTGFGTPKTLTERTTQKLYNITISTSTLSLGEHYYSITASKFTYETQIIAITINVIQRTAFIDNVYLNQVERTSISRPWNEILNVSITYNDTLTNSFIRSATVQLTGPSISKVLTERNNQYNTSINTRLLSLGLNFLTISASEVNHTLSTQIITVTVNERDTIMDIYLNKTLTSTITYPWSELLNITAKYKDQSTSAFITGAAVQLKDGAVVVGTLAQSGQQYWININTTTFGVGVKALTVYAKQTNYTVSVGAITLTISERTTDLTIYLNKTQTTIITFPYGEVLNITAKYKDHTKTTFIAGATVQLKDGAIVVGTLTQNLQQYTLNINTNTFGVGVKALTVYAKQTNYTVSLGAITITISERTTDMIVYLNKTLTTTITFPYGQLLNVTSVYKDHATSSFISGATVQLKDGATVLGTLTQNGQQYTLNINTNKFGVGVKALTISAKKDNYSIYVASITVSVENIETNLDIFVNDINSMDFVRFNSSIGEFLNITAIYKDYNGTFVLGATVELSSTSFSGSLIKHPVLNQYNITVMADQLGGGVKIVTISAKKNNYLTITQEIIISVTLRNTEMQLFLNGVNCTDGKYLQIEVGVNINVTVTYKDSITKAHITTASINLIGFGTLDENVILYQYNITVNSGALGQGINFLTIYAEKLNYDPQSILFTIEIIEKQTRLDLFLNDINKTLDRSIEITIGESVNVTIIYEDLLNNFVSGATVEITGEKFSESLSMHPLYNQYNITINSLNLTYGVNFLTLYAYRVNYQQQTILIKIEIIDKRTELQLFLNTEEKTLDRSIQIMWNAAVNITITYKDIEAMPKTHILGANVSLTGIGAIKYLTENFALKQYTIIINSATLQLGSNYLTIYAQRINYQSQTIILNINVIVRATSLDLFLNTVDETIDRHLTIVYGETINITNMYKDIDNIPQIHIAGAVLSLTGVGSVKYLTENGPLGQYSIIINSASLQLGINYLVINAQQLNYSSQSIIFNIEVVTRDTFLVIFLNQENNTIDKEIELPIRSLLNITIKYMDTMTKQFVNSASIQLTGEGLSDYLTENALLQQYSITLDTSDLDIGVRYLNIYASKGNYTVAIANLKITVIRISTSITTEDGKDIEDLTVNLEPGDNYKLVIILNDDSFGEKITGAKVTFTSNIVQEGLKDGEFKETEDGVYEFTFENMPEGTYIVTISVIASDDYDFARYEITFNIVRPAEDVLLFQIITGVSIAAAAIVGTYFVAYQKVLKYPKPVRKIHKFKKTLKKTKSPELDISARDNAVKGIFDEELLKRAKFLKPKLKVASKEQPLPDKLADIKPKDISK